MPALDIVVWICVGIFFVTAVITLGALVGLIPCLGGGDCANHHYYLKRLFGALILEIVGVSVVAYAAALNSKDREQLETISQEIRKQLTATVASVDPLKALPGTSPVVREILQQKAYATSDGPRTDEKVVKVPEGWRYVDAIANAWTKTAGASYTVTPIVDPKTKEVTEVKLVATAEKQQLFGPRDWVGVDLNVTIEKKPSN